MSTIIRQKLPAELLRRSCRVKKQATLTSKSHKTNQNQNIQQTIKKETEKFQSETNVATNLKINKPELIITLKEEYNSHLEQKCDIKVDDSEADGFIEINEDDLNLERTLLGGQSFRWTKKSIASAEDGNYSFNGVILNTAIELWRPNPDRLAYKILHKVPNDTDILNTTELLKDYFQLNYDLQELYQEWSSRDKHLAECCMQYKGFRILRQDPVENVFSFICATNNNIKRISQMIEKLCNRFGDDMGSRDGCSQFKSFPKVERLAQDDVFQCLRYELGFGYRAKFITESAKRIIQKSKECKFSTTRDYLLSLRANSYKDTCRQLMQFPGIGRKVADCICLMSMDHLESVPTDCHIYEIVCRDYLPNLRKQTKKLNESVHDIIGGYFKNLHGPLAGWSTSVLFIAELKHLKVSKDPIVKKEKRIKNMKETCKK